MFLLFNETPPRLDFLGQTLFSFFFFFLYIFFFGDVEEGKEFQEDDLQIGDENFKFVVILCVLWL